MKRGRKQIIAGALLAALGALHTPAQSSTAVLEQSAQTEHVTTRFVSEQAVVAPGGRVSVLLLQQVRSGWHTYWLNPGDTGQATRISWHLPPAASAAPIQWPTPQRILLSSLVNYGYEGQAGLISELTVPANLPHGAPFALSADVTWLVCADLCVPEHQSFTLSIPSAAAPSANTSAAGLFSAARAALPVPSPWPATLRAEQGRVTLSLALAASAKTHIVEAQFFPADEGIIDQVAKQQFQVHDGALTISAPKGDEALPRAASGIVTIGEDTGGGIVHTALLIGSPASSASGVPGVAAGSASPAPSDAGMGVALVLLSALIGGLLLNLMPCVFPVLAMKALSLVDHANLTPRERIAGGVAYTAGVFVCFLILGAALLALKAGGAAVGWGFQLQNPALVALLAYVLFVAGLNLSGVFEFGGSFMGVGSGLASRGSTLGSFFTGMLAAVVATPCSAPFMAPAIGVALTQSAFVAMLTFVVLGFGLALPYLLLSFVPAVARALPKPGRWMGTLKQVLAYPMYASAAWMVWVLAQQAGADGMLEVLLGMIAVAFALWLWGLRGGSTAGRTVRVATVIVVLIASFVVALRVVPQRGEAATARASGELSEPFTAARLDALRAAGKPVFVNLTAAWCITCKVNERIALSGQGFRTALHDGGYTYLKGDWTQQNPEITQVLSLFGRAGVPLYLVYPAHGGQSQVLPQLLTEAAVVQALNDHHS